MTIVPIKSGPRADHLEAAEYLRDLADRFEAGDISEAVIVLNDREGGHFESWGHFDDRWRLLGALEYAKQGLAKQ
jgi:hypothetical protein